MKKITLKVCLALSLLLSGVAKAQLTQDFETWPPTDWTIESTNTSVTWDAEPEGITGQSASVLYDFDQNESLISPVFSLPAGSPILKFNVSLSYYWSVDPNNNYDCLVSISDDGGFTWTQIWDESLLGVFDNYVPYAINIPLTAYAGGTNLKLKFNYVGNDGAQLLIDDVSADLPPACAPVSDLTNTSATMATASFSWTSALENFEYVLDNTASDPAGAGTATTLTTYSATGLDSNTTYYFHVRATMCADGNSDWTTISFTTAAVATACLNADDFGQYPDETFIPNVCDGLTPNIIADNAYAGEYSVVAVTLGQTYTFTSSIPTDFITISTDDGATGAVYGQTPVVWVSTIDGEVRFYTHTDADCGEEGEDRTRAVLCGIAPCVMPAVTFETANNCPAATFNITANISNMGSATSITVTDDQSSTPQTITAANTVTFGPYAFGTDVVITVANDQVGACTISSDSLTLLACPPANDECSGAIALVPGGDFAGGAMNSTSLGASGDATLPSCQENVAGNVWYTVTVPASGNISIETNPLDGSDFTDSVIVAYSGTCGSLTEIECDDDDSDSGYFSLLNLTGRTPGEVIYVSVWRFSFEGSGLDGDFQVSAYDVSLATNSFESTDGFRAYPNPVKNILNLSYNKNISNVSVFNLLGQEVLTKAMNTNESQIDMSALANGAYMVKITTDNQIKTIKVIKE